MLEKHGPDVYFNFSGQEGGVSEQVFMLHAYKIFLLLLTNGFINKYMYANLPYIRSLEILWGGSLKG